ncbi:probable LIM domain-containing serine/threonine-protein kinase DDB_G0287001 [Apostichopus japonicus]|uniref:probable LIM domain-containing serine/threonine-protein kinase DDB_G0287001 n=1 Tax=Stichopus japonicus TaxID=307972 RepID=UPI003AB8EC43
MTVDTEERHCYVHNSVGDNYIICCVFIYSCKDMFCYDSAAKTVVRLIIDKLGQEHPGISDRLAGLAIRRAFPGVRRNRPGCRKARRQMCYYGISFNKNKSPIYNGIPEKVNNPELGLIRKRRQAINFHVPPHFQIDKKLLSFTVCDYDVGRGSFGKCRQGYYRGIQVAIKEFTNPRQLGENGLRCEVEHEISMMLRLQQHEGLSHLIGADTTSTPFLLLTQLYHVNGRPLTVSSALRQPSANVTIPLAPIDWKNVIQKCAEAVLTVHNSGILHNDIKDNNVVLHLQDGQYSPVLIDFGKACLITQGRKLRLNSKEREQWKVRYRNLAPELVDGKEAESTATDVYSFGHFVRCISRMTHEQSKLFKEIYVVCTNSSDKRASLSLVLKVLTGEIKI